MAWTQTDLENIEAGIITIATQGVVEIELDGQRTKYMSLSSLLNLRDKVKAELSQTNNGGLIKIQFDETSDA